LKKIILLLLALSSLLLAESKIYLGAGYLYDNENISYASTSKTINENAARIKIGYGDRKAYAVEFSFDYVDNTSEIFAANDGKKYGFNVDLLKAYDFGIYVNPFLKAGIGAGYLETDADTTNQSLTYGSFNLGTGVFIPLGEHFDIEIAYEYKNLSYQKIDSNSERPTSTLQSAYIGFNIRY